MDSGPAAYENETNWLKNGTTKNCGASAPGVCDPSAGLTDADFGPATRIVDNGKTVIAPEDETIYAAENLRTDPKLQQALACKGTAQCIAAAAPGVFLAAAVAYLGGHALAARIFGPTAVATGAVGAASSKFPFPDFQAWGARVWGTGADGARQALANMTPQVARTFDPDKVRQALTFYQRAVDLGKGGETAPIRVKLMQTIIDLQK